MGSQGLGVFLQFRHHQRSLGGTHFGIEPGVKVTAVDMRSLAARKFVSITTQDIVGSQPVHDAATTLVIDRFHPGFLGCAR